MALAPRAGVTEDAPEKEQLMSTTAPRHVLVLTSCIGGGHVFRDLAIGRELERLAPGHRIVFASGGAAYRMIAEEGVPVEEIAGMPFPAHLGTVDFLKVYFAVLHSELKQLFDLKRLVAKYRPELVVLDEYFFLADYCRWKGIPVVFMSDFVGVPREPFVRSPLRALLERFFDWWISGWLPRRVARWIYIGAPQLIPSAAWRERARRRGLDFVEPISKLQYTPPPARDEARRRLGISPGLPVVTVSVGATEVGGYLLEAANQAAALLREAFPDLTMELVCGMGIDPGELARKAKPGVRVHGYVRNLEELFAASDAAVVQCGLTTTTECMMIGVPTLLVPLANHWEQMNTARFAAEVGGLESLSADRVTAATLAEKIRGLLEGKRRPAAAYQGDGHVRAAQLIAGALPGSP
jgi:UDP-N-acetylglucosamine:LPS N-acetylglucosamine transferase